MLTKVFQSSRVWTEWYSSHFRYPLAWIICSSTEDDIPLPCAFLLPVHNILPTYDDIRHVWKCDILTAIDNIPLAWTSYSSHHLMIFLLPGYDILLTLGYIPHACMIFLTQENINFAWTWYSYCPRWHSSSGCDIAPILDHIYFVCMWYYSCPRWYSYGFERIFLLHQTIFPSLDMIFLHPSCPRWYSSCLGDICKTLGDNPPAWMWYSSNPRLYLSCWNMISLLPCYDIPPTLHDIPLTWAWYFSMLDNNRQIIKSNLYFVIFFTHNQHKYVVSDAIRIKLK